MGDIFELYNAVVNAVVFILAVFTAVFAVLFNRNGENSKKTTDAISKLKDELDTQKELNEALQNRIKNFENENKEREEMITALQNRVITLFEKVSSMQNQLDKSEKNYKEASQRALIAEAQLSGALTVIREGNFNIYDQIVKEINDGSPRESAEAGYTDEVQAPPPLADTEK